MALVESGQKASNWPRRRTSNGPKGAHASIGNDWTEWSRVPFISRHVSVSVVETGVGNANAELPRRCSELKTLLELWYACNIKTAGACCFHAFPSIKLRLTLCGRDKLLHLSTAHNTPLPSWVSHSSHRPALLVRHGLPSSSVSSLRLVVYVQRRCSAVSLATDLRQVLFGYDTGTIGGILAMPYWLKTFSTGALDSSGNPTITTSESSEIVSILSAGTFFGALTAAPVGDIIGRRFGLMFSAGIVFNLGVILQTAATTIPTFVAGRFFAGYGVGLVSALIPLYQSETAPKWIRGTIVGAYQLAITIGLLLASVVDNSTHLRNDTGSYRIPIAVQFAWSLILCIGMLILPETPRMWIKRGKPERAAKSLGTLRRLDVDHPAIVDELAEIQANHEYETSLGKASYIDCFKGSLGKRLATGCLLQALQQLTGVNFIFYYGTSFFTKAGIKSPFVVSMTTSVSPSLPLNRAEG